MKSVSSKWKKNAYHSSFYTKFHVCTDYLNHRNEKCSLPATKGQPLGNEHFLLSFLQRILIGNSEREKIKRHNGKPFKQG